MKALSYCSNSEGILQGQGSRAGALELSEMALCRPGVAVLRYSFSHQKLEGLRMTGFPDLSEDRSRDPRICAILVASSGHTENPIDRREVSSLFVPVDDYE